jgi:GTPase
MLIDEIEIIVKGGHGGPGKVSFFRPPQKGPDGGNGGKGGDVYLKTTTDLGVLSKFTTIRSLSAENGGAGGSNKKSGKNGEDLEILIPYGAQFTEVNTGEQFELEKGQRILICKGGKGGKGNEFFKSSTNTTPKYAQKGLEGQQKHYKIILRFIADIGLMGLPNAGKSSLLNELTNSQAKIASYPFTTLEPNLGVFEDKTIADIPGLIEGASEGKGLGIKFLKHIEKVDLLLHCISAESEDLKKDYKIVRNELKQFNPDLVKKNEMILITKSDLVQKDELKKKINELKGLKKKIYTVSIHDWESMEKLKEVLKAT